MWNSSIAWKGLQGNVFSEYTIPHRSRFFNICLFTPFPIASYHFVPFVHRLLFSFPFSLSLPCPLPIRPSILPCCLTGRVCCFYLRDIGSLPRARRRVQPDGSPGSWPFASLHVLLCKLQPSDEHSTPGHTLRSPSFLNTQTVAS